MAPSTLVLELRRRKREAKRVNRSEARRSNLRASTLATAATTDPDAQGEGEGEAEDGDDDGGGGKNKGRRGRVAQHIATTRTIRKPLTQTQLIEAALEEEERNKEALRDWLKKEEEKRELRRVGRKVVKGPRWTWVSRTVGRLVEEVPESEEKSEEQSQEKSRGEAEKSQGQDTPQHVTSPKAPQSEESKINPPPLPSAKSQSQSQSPKNSMTIKPAPDAYQPSPPVTEAQPQSEPNAPYTRNYIILSQIPGGLPAELQIVLGSHVEWDKLKIIPSRNRPISVFLIQGCRSQLTNYTFKQTDKSRSALSPTSPRNTDTLPPASHSLPKKDTERLKRFCGIGMNGLNRVVGGVGEKGMFGRMGWGVCGGWKWGRG